MNKMFYKIAMLFKGDLTEIEIDTEYAKVLEILKEHGEITQELKPNKIGLAYPIAKIRDAYFATVKFEPKAEAIIDFKVWLNKANLLRIMITKNDSLTVEKVIGFSPIAKVVEGAVAESMVGKTVVQASVAETARVGVLPLEEIAPTVQPISPVSEIVPAKEEKPEIDMNALDEKLEELLKE
ncbi:MAG: 30S ribosomal protein S6 [Candidatus Parcubacteria bacterium]|nr:30S ribosomal protein S6 [Candidatus Parcubacteria bacterium]